MSFVYEDPDLVTDVATLKANVETYLLNYMPAGFKIAPGSLLDFVIEAISIQAAQQADVLVQQLVSQFRYFGSLVGLPPIDAIPPIATATYTVPSSSSSQTIPAAMSRIGIADANGVIQGFNLEADLVIAPSSTSGSGTVVAEAAGTAAEGLSGSAQVISTPPFVTGCTLTAATGGVDAETDPTYLGRLVETLATLSPIPVLGTDYAVLARSIAGVYRACGVNLLKPGSPYDGSAEATGVEKNITVAVTDINGANVGSTILMQVQAYLSSLREQNYVIWAVNPQRATIDVQATVYAWPGYDLPTVQAAVAAAVTAFLSPASFATDPSGNAARWANDPVVRISDLYQTIMSASQGVRYIDGTTLKVGLHGGTLATTDYTMGAGSAIPALPTPGTVTITVDATTS